MNLSTSILYWEDWMKFNLARYGEYCCLVRLDKEEQKPEAIVMSMITSDGTLTHPVDALKHDVLLQFMGGDIYKIHEIPHYVRIKRLVVHE